MDDLVLSEDNKVGNQMLPSPRNQSQSLLPSRREGAAVSQELRNVWKDKCVGIIHTTHCEGRACLVDKTWNSSTRTSTCNHQYTQMYIIQV